MKRSKEGVGKRRRAREIAVQMLYQQELGGSTLEQIFAGYALEEYVRETDFALTEKTVDETRRPESGASGPPPASPRPSRAKPAARSMTPSERVELIDSFTYARQLVEGVTVHGEKIDQLIRRHAENWRLERMPVIDRNILRLAVYEMLHQSGVPKVVIVDEAIELAKKFGSEHSGRFVNGLLDGILRSRAVVAANENSLGAAPAGSPTARGSS